MPIGHPPFIGQSVPRVEDDRLLRGEGCYVSDLRLANTVHAAFVRSPVARARLLAVRTSEAERHPGVLLVLTGRMTAGLDALSVNPVVPGIRLFHRPLLAIDRLNAVGEAIAMVVAGTLEAALEAVELVEVEYEALQPAVATHEAGAAEPLFSGWQDNYAFSQEWERGDVRQCFEEAAHVIEVDFTMPRVAPMPLEPRATLATWTSKPDLLTVYLGTQTPHRARTEIARILELDRSSVRVVTPDVGGAFGGKASIYPEEVLVAAASIRLGRPVRWVATRNEDFTSASHGRGGHLKAQASLTADGRITAIRADVEFPIGLWGTYSAAVPAINAARILPGPYAVPVVKINTRGVVTNTAPVGIYRGAGRPEAAMLMERLLERAALTVSLDPVEIRRRNLLRAADLPLLTPTGQRLDSGDYRRMLDLALEASDYVKLRREQVERRAAGELFGIGICVYVEPCGLGWESARLTRAPDGRVTLACGTSSQGQGHRTAMAQIAADCLGIAFDEITVLEGDTATTPAGVGALASRSIAIGGSAVKRAAEELLAKIAALSGPQTEPVEASVSYNAPHEAWSSGCAVSSVSVDAETGELQVLDFVWVDDAGLVINPKLVEGQLLGGLAQGLGQVLCERLYYDGDGQLLTGSLMDYAVLRADQMPRIELRSIHSSTDANALGAKGVGESGCIVAPAAIYNAALDAVAPLGITDLPIPLSSENIWLAIKGH